MNTITEMTSATTAPQGVSDGTHPWWRSERSETTQVTTAGAMRHARTVVQRVRNIRVPAPAHVHFYR